MIYLDNAATTWPKPPSVNKAVYRALIRFGGNPGRGGHRLSMQAAEAVYGCREALADFFGISDPARVFFTRNCTEGLNLFIHTIAQNGGHVVISDLEHNAVIRPLEEYRRLGRLSYDVAEVDPFSAENTLRSFSDKMRRDTVALICTQASNVFGIAPPLAEIAALAHRRGALICVDGAQGAGVLPTHLQDDGIDVYCAPGHKGLYGPMGVGFVLWNTTISPCPLIYGGTGTLSASAVQPVDLPEAVESGTVNVPGICGLCAGVESLAHEKRAAALAHEREWVHRFALEAARLPGVTVFDYSVTGAPVLSFAVENLHSEIVAERLNEAEIAVRAGLHCAPAAHRKMHTEKSGTVRIAPSRYTSFHDLEPVLTSLKKISRA